jgi:guanylate kinase
MPDKMAFSVSATTRKPRPGEENGREYHFLESDDFEKRIENNEFLEHEEVYAGVLYGTLWSEVHKIWDAGKAVVFDVDVQGGLNLKRRFKQDALAIFLRPPSVEILMQRLRKRSTEVEHHLQERIAKANHELSFENQYDVVVVNDVLEDTLKTCEKLVTDFLNKP